MGATTGGVVLGPGAGAQVAVLGLGVTVKARGADTGGAYLAFEAVFPPGQGVPPHIHRNDVEAIYVLEGVLEARIGDRPVRATAGSFQLIPRGTVHTSSNPGPEPARAPIVFSPSAFEGFLDEVAGTPPDRVPALAAKYGMELVEP